MKFSLISFLLGITWTLSCVWVLLNYDEITHSGWVVPKVFAIIFVLVTAGGAFSYLVLHGATANNEPPTKRSEPKYTDTEITHDTEAVELPPIHQLKTIYKNNTL